MFLHWQCFWLPTQVIILLAFCLKLFVLCVAVCFFQSSPLLSSAGPNACNDTGRLGGDRSMHVRSHLMKNRNRHPTLVKTSWQL